MITRNARETTKYAQKFAQTLNGGEVIGLIGDLGSGKTVFAQGLAKSLGVKENITSPTFVILKEYNILRPKSNLRGWILQVKKFVHADAYRAESVQDIESVGIEDYFHRSDVIMVIEWADKIKQILPKNTIYLKFKSLNETEREIIKLKK